METLNTHLVSVARNLVLSADELAKIQISISNLKTKLNSWFGGALITHFQFGSSTRGTILPRKVDSDSDIDYMVVFENKENYKPETLLNRLRKFVEAKYTRSDIYQSHPTIVLELSHIKFELVPAVQPYVFNNNYHIPAPALGFMDWMITAPADLKQKIDEADVRYHYQIKRLIRLLKYWNVMTGRVFSSYEIEEYVGSLVFYGGTMLEDYFFYAVKWLPENRLPEYKKNKVQKLKQVAEEIQKDYSNGFRTYALGELRKLLPMP